MPIAVDPLQNSFNILYLTPNSPIPIRTDRKFYFPYMVSPNNASLSTLFSFITLAFVIALL